MTLRQIIEIIFSINTHIINSLVICKHRDKIRKFKTFCKRKKMWSFLPPPPLLMPVISYNISADFLIQIYNTKCVIGIRNILVIGLWPRVGIWLVLFPQVFLQWVQRNYFFLRNRSNGLPKRLRVWALLCTLTDFRNKF